ncbi:unnamed protein product [Ectocarpus sp. CCAP 1310/34]|nr:unnamed protein product [Ectocarpus sp. CCAP 1310/34]
MALFGDEDGDVGPFVMAEVEGGDEWFPFSLDNLEMDRACNASLQDDSRPMDQDGDGETDQDDDVDAGNPSAEASGPGPPPPAPNPDGGGGGGGGNSWNEDRYQQQDGGTSNGSSGGGVADSSAKVQQGRGGARKGVVLSEPKMRLDKVKPEAKEVGAVVGDTCVQVWMEVHASHDRKRHTSEAAAPAKRSSRGEKSGGGSSSKSRQKHHHPAGGMAGGVGGMTGRAEGQAGWTASSDTKHSTRTGGDGGDGGTTTKASKTSSISGGNGGSMTKAPTVQNKRRLERNAREQKRSLKISQRIEDLRRMLSQFGVDVKASKSAVLSEATDYIAHLQRQHAQSEAERARILQLLHNSRAASPSSAAAAAAGRTVKPPPSGVPAPALPTQHGAGDRGAGVGVVVERPSSHTMLDTLLSLDDDGDMGRPTSAMTAARAMVFPPPTPPQQGEEQIVPGFPNLSAAARSGVDGMPVAPSAAAAAGTVAAGRALVAMGGAAGGTESAMGAANLAATARALSHVNYERVFRTLPMPMAIANVNGNLVDCNTRLTQVTGFRKEEALFMTIFDLVADPFLQHTFSMISSILSMRGVNGNPPFFQVPGKIFNGNPGGGGVQISAVLDDQLRPMHFCICILDSPATGGVSAPASAVAAAAAVAGTAAGGTAGVGSGGSGSGGSGPGGGVVQISAVLDDQLRPMHFCICILDSPATGGVSAPASAVAAAAAVAGTAAGGTAGVGSGGSGSGGSGSGGDGSGSCIRVRANVG